MREDKVYPLMRKLLAPGMSEVLRTDAAPLKQIRYKPADSRSDRVKVTKSRHNFGRPRPPLEAAGSGELPRVGACWRLHKPGGQSSSPDAQNDGRRARLAILHQDALGC
eukprot:358956-Chlamydomonas_euryale.AAC.2